MALTTPPLISFIGACLAWLRGSRFVYWVMDFNPDEAIAAGWLRADSIVGRTLERMSRFSLRQARKIIALDRFMRDRIVAKGIAPSRVAVIAPWSHDTEVRFDPAGRERFRKAHGIDGKFVVMYSGNHSPVHPLDTLLAAAQRLASDPGIVFCFIGGGSEWRKLREKVEGRMQNAECRGVEVEDVRRKAQNVAQASLPASSTSIPAGVLPSTTKSPRPSPLAPRPAPQIQCLPYQPLDHLAGSLSAADLHVVVMGDAFVGLVHPCKIYNVLSVASPVLYIGPHPSHLSEILDAISSEHPCAAVAHGEVDRAVQAIERLRRDSRPTSRLTPARVRSFFSQEVLLSRLVEELESS